MIAAAGTPSRSRCVCGPICKLSLRRRKALHQYAHDYHLLYAYAAREESLKMQVEYNEYMDNDQQSPFPRQTTPDPIAPARAMTAQESVAELRQAIKGSNQILTTATTVFPLTLFPDTLTVDRAKLTITKRRFLWSAEVMSIQIEDILNVTATVGPFFGNIKISSRIPTAAPYFVHNFWRNDALRIKRITQGYIIARQQGIDCSSLSTQELAAMLDKLGEDDHAT